MLSPKLFILSECENAKAALDQSLRHDFGSDRSKLYFDEVTLRLNAFRDRFSSVKEHEVGVLSTASSIISELSTCLSLIERSHLGEFSWAFADAFIELANPICEEPKITEPGSIKPIFYISSKGGLKAYQIVCESDLLLEFANQRIFNIVFPHSLTHHVLLHAIIGHELCHAALVSDVSLARIKTLFDTNVSLQTDTEATTWYRGIRTDCALVFSGHLSRWKTEFLCDLFGLVLFGPAFLAALKALLSGVDPTGLGDDLSQRSHPPPLSRIQLLQQAAEILDWSGAHRLTAIPKEAYIQLLADLSGFSDGNPEKFQIITRNDLAITIDALKKYFETRSICSYKDLDETVICQLYQDLDEGIPPSGSRFNEALQIENIKVDFRLQLTAGWLWWAQRSHHENKEALTIPDYDSLKLVRNEFLFINKLCERGILQRKAIRLALDNPNRKAVK